MTDLIEADAMVIHVNPLQELIQREGETDFSNLHKQIEKICTKINIPIIVKEVGSGISKKAAKKLIELGVRGIDVAGAGGTSWAAVELIRNNESSAFFREWGIPTSYCIRTCAELKRDYNFTLISSGGIENGIDIAKSLCLGADLTASARFILKKILEIGIDGVIDFVNLWFEDVKKIMYLTGSKNLKELKKQNLIRKTDLY